MVVEYIFCSRPRHVKFLLFSSPQRLFVMLYFVRALATAIHDDNARRMCTVYLSAPPQWWWRISTWFSSNSRKNGRNTTRRYRITSPAIASNLIIFTVHYILLPRDSDAWRKSGGASPPRNISPLPPPPGRGGFIVKTLPSSREHHVAPYWRARVKCACARWRDRTRKSDTICLAERVRFLKKKKIIIILILRETNAAKRPVRQKKNLFWIERWR